MTEQDLFQLIREPYAWPGGYPKVLIMADGECLCTQCADAEKASILRAMAYNTNDGWLPAGVDINWEDQEMYCAHCNEPIPAAYEA
jgi:hypothetical protein